MALENGGMSPADMAAVMGTNNNGFGNDGFAGWWMMWFLLIALMGGGLWGNWGGGYGGGGMGGAVPYIGATADVQRGFDQSAVINAISGLSDKVGDGFSDAAVARCQGNAALTQAVTSGDTAITQAVTNSQYATAQAINGAKDAVTNGMNALGLSILQGNCDNKAGVADLKYTVATEACADRAAVTNGLQQLTMQNNVNTNAITSAIASGIQSIKDDLCADRLAAKDAQIQELQTKLNMATLSGSQVAQTADLKEYVAQLVQQAVTSCCPKPIPAYNVPNPGCGCGGYGA